VDDWADQRLAEIEARLAAGTNKRKHTKTTRRRLHEDGEPYGMPLLRTTADLAKVLRKPEIFVWVYVHHRAAITNKDTFTVPNGEVALYGVSKQAKLRGLEIIAETGAVTINRDRNLAVTVTLNVSTRRRKTNAYL
jgi:hypothetical protein